MEQLNYVSLLPELLEAINDGYPENFIVNTNGLLLCLNYPNKFYELDELDIGPPIILSIPGTLFRISTKDGLWRGTLIDFEY